MPGDGITEVGLSKAGVLIYIRCQRGEKLSSIKFSLPSPSFIQEGLPPLGVKEDTGRTKPEVEAI